MLLMVLAVHLAVAATGVGERLGRAGGPAGPVPRKRRRSSQRLANVLWAELRIDEDHA